MGFLQPCRHSSSPRPFLISFTGSDVHTEVKKNCFDWLSFMPSIFWVTPDIQNKGMWLIFPTNCFQGLLLSWVIRHVPALLHCFCCRAGIVVWHFQIHFKFQKKKDRKWKKIGGGGVQVALAQGSPKYTDERQALSFFTKHHEAGRRRSWGWYRKSCGRAGNCVCFPGFG